MSIKVVYTPNTIMADISKSNIFESFIKNCVHDIKHEIPHSKDIVKLFFSTHEMRYGVGQLIMTKLPFDMQSLVISFLNDNWYVCIDVWNTWCRLIVFKDTSGIQQGYVVIKYTVSGSVVLISDTNFEQNDLIIDSIEEYISSILINL